MQTETRYTIKPATLSGDTSPEALAAEDWWEQCPKCGAWVGKGMMNSHQAGRCGHARS